MSHPKNRTREQVLSDLDATGTTVTELADQLQVKRTALSDVLHGRNKGKRGVGHDLAVYLGFKSGSIRHLTHLKRRIA